MSFRSIILGLVCYGTVSLANAGPLAEFAKHFSGSQDELEDNLDRLTQLLEQGEKINASVEFPLLEETNTLLGLAIKHDLRGLWKFLLETQQPWVAKNFNVYAHLALSQDRAQFFEDANPYLNRLIKDGLIDRIVLAAQNSAKDCLLFFKELSRNLNVQNRKKQSPLSVAIANEDADLVEFLLNQKVSYSKRAAFGSKMMTPIAYLSSLDELTDAQEEIKAALLKYGSKVDYSQTLKKSRSGRSKSPTRGRTFDLNKSTKVKSRRSRTPVKPRLSSTAKYRSTSARVSSYRPARVPAEPEVPFADKIVVDGTFEDIWGEEVPHEDFLTIYEVLRDQEGAFARYSKNGAVPSLLMYGPAGTGKTTMARALASELGTAFWVASQFKDARVGNAEKNLEKVVLGCLAWAEWKDKEVYARTGRRVHTKVMLFIDEIDTIITKQAENSSTSAYHNELNGVFKRYWGGDSVDPNVAKVLSRVVLVGTTNHKGNMPDPIVNRFSYSIELDAASPELKMKVLRGKLAEFKSVSGITEDDISGPTGLYEQLTGCNLRDIVKAVDNAKMRAFREGAQARRGKRVVKKEADGTETEVENPGLVQKWHIMEALKNRVG